MKPESPTRKAAKEIQTKLNREWARAHEGKPELVEDLERNFSVRSPLKRDKNGSVDVYQTIANCGALEAIEFIRQRIQLGIEGK